MESTLKEYNSPRKRNLGVFVANTWQSFHVAIATPTTLPVYTHTIHNFFDCYFHIPTDRNETRIWSSLFLQKPLHKILYKSVHNLFSYCGHRQTHRQTHKPMPIKTYSHAFAGKTSTLVLLIVGPIRMLDASHAALCWVMVCFRFGVATVKRRHEAWKSTCLLVMDKYCYG